MNASLDRSYAEFNAALAEYTSLESEPTILHYSSISTAGEAYFSQLRMIADAILSGTVDPESAKNTFARIINEAVTISLPAYYETLAVIAEKKHFEYPNRLNRENYASIYKVNDKYNNT